MTDKKVNGGERTPAVNQELADAILTIEEPIKCWVIITDSGNPIMGPAHGNLSDLNLGVDMCKQHILRQLQLPPQARQKPQKPLEH